MSIIKRHFNAGWGRPRAVREAGPPVVHPWERAAACAASYSPSSRCISATSRPFSAGSVISSEASPGRRFSRGKLERSWKCSSSFSRPKSGFGAFGSPGARHRTRNSFYLGPSLQSSLSPSTNHGPPVTSASSVPFSWGRASRVFMVFPPVGVGGGEWWVV